MWKLVKIQEANRPFYLSKYIQINKNLRNDSEEDSLIHAKLAKSIHEFLHKVTLTLDSKSKETEDFFSSATKKIEESLKNSTQFMSKEVAHAKKSVLQLAKISEIQLESYSGCVNQYNEDIRNIKKTYNEKIKSCTEKTVIGVETIRSKYENDLQDVRDLKKLTTRALKECLDKKSNIKHCIDDKMKSAHDRYKHTLQNLQEASNSSKKSVLKLLKIASICHENAQSDILKNLPKIVEKTIICIKNSKERNKSESPALVIDTFFDDEKKSEEMLQQKITIIIKAPNKEMIKVAKEEKMECLQEAKKDALNSMNLILHEIEAAEKITENFQKSDKADPLLQDFIRYFNEIVQDSKLVLKKCTKEDGKVVEADILKCLAEFFDSIKLKKFELIKRVDALKKDNKKSSLDIDKALKWISTAEEKLKTVDKIFQECTKAGKK
ncbi:uncharacterized protein PFB0765w-like [Belonocnema kinseyi]|uniref:uncharacterized protein PFB0765w-like n=1 Tax=Belonocnema kinseyi TaxID=2817044 RepID=UPI00143DD05E|nr:uncharacterized protein PFB0765w-like [Belonocnema kinseyi]